MNNSNYKICPKCNNNVLQSSKFCPNCGNKFPLMFVKINNFDVIYNNKDNKMLELYIQRELSKLNIDSKSKKIPYDSLKQVQFLNIAILVLIFLFVCLIFFHFPIYTYIIGLIILFFCNKKRRKYNLNAALAKEIKERPNEKMKNIIFNKCNNLTTDPLRGLYPIGLIAAILLPMVIFFNPHIMYEKVASGYAVRFYTFGLTNFKTATIPETYKGEPVVSMRGNAFSNMFFLKAVTLPDSIVEIRGQAFKNDYLLEEVKLPGKLEYLGGGSFYNCASLTHVSLPDSITYIGGEVFYKAKNLKEITLPSKIQEIRGDSFAYCSSLEKIEIPDSVERIGGHAFYYATSLSSVKFTKNSRLREIGSSAFRNCSSLNKIFLPYNVSVNERAFKNSPTIIKNIDDVDFSNLFDESKFKQWTLKNAPYNETSDISLYGAVNIPKEGKITVKKIKVDDEYRKFDIVFENSDGKVSFTLDRFHPYYEVNNDLIITIKYESDYNNTSYEETGKSVYYYYN